MLHKSFKSIFVRNQILQRSKVTRFTQQKRQFSDEIQAVADAMNSSPNGGDSNVLWAAAVIFFGLAWNRWQNSRFAFGKDTVAIVEKEEKPDEFEEIRQRLLKGGKDVWNVTEVNVNKFKSDVEKIKSDIVSPYATYSRDRLLREEDADTDALLAKKPHHSVGKVFTASDLQAMEDNMTKRHASDNVLHLNDLAKKSRENLESQAHRLESQLQKAEKDALNHLSSLSRTLNLPNEAVDNAKSWLEHAKVKALEMDPHTFDRVTLDKMDKLRQEASREIAKFQDDIASGRLNRVVEDEVLTSFPHLHPDGTSDYQPKNLHRFDDASYSHPLKTAIPIVAGVASSLETPPGVVSPEVLVQRAERAAAQAALEAQIAKQRAETALNLPSGMPMSLPEFEGDYKEKAQRVFAALGILGDEIDPLPHFLAGAACMSAALSAYYMNRTRASLLIGLASIGYFGSASLIGREHSLGHKNTLEERQGYDLGTLTSLLVLYSSLPIAFKSSVFLLLTGVGGVSLIANGAKAMELRKNVKVQE